MKKFLAILTLPLLMIACNSQPTEPEADDAPVIEESEDELNLGIDNAEAELDLVE